MARPVFAWAREHEPKLIRREHALRAVHGTSALGQFNMRIAVRITSIVGSMWCAYAFAVLALISFPAAIRSGDPIIIVAWIAQTFLQLILLPIIIVGQNVQAAATEARAEADHQTLTAIHTLSVTVHAINEQQTTILELLEKRSEPPQPPASPQ
jgi:hypothetical protein